MFYTDYTGIVLSIIISVNLISVINYFFGGANLIDFVISLFIVIITSFFGYSYYKRLYNG